MSLFSRLLKAPADFVENKVDEVRGEVRAEIADGLASASVYIVLGTMALFSLLFLSLALSIGIAMWTGYYYLGFLAMGAVYAIMAYAAWRLSRNGQYMEELKARFHVIMKADEKKPAGEKKKADFAAYENDL